MFFKKNFSRAAWLVVFALAVGAQLTLFRPKPEVAEFFRAFFRSEPSEEEHNDLPVTEWVPRSSDDNPLPRGTAIVPDDGGPIQAVVIYFEIKWEQKLKPLFDDLFLKLPLSVQLQVACADASSLEQFEEDWGKHERSRGRSVVVFNAKRHLTMWARDRHIALQDPVGHLRVSLIPRLKASEDRDRLDEVGIPKLRYRLGLIDRIGYIPYLVEGGNVVANRRHVFVGKNVLTDNDPVLENDNVLQNELEILFGRQLVLLGDWPGNVPYPHLDMYFTPVSEDTVLLADLSEGASLLELESGRDLLAVLRPNRQKQQQLDNTASSLRKLGYKVLRIPAVEHALDGWMISYNNVLMEHRDGKQIVYMPVYHLSHLDKAAASIYQQLGFQVETVDASEIFRNGGTLRCTVNVVLRQLPPPLVTGK